jgi:hypothetical protein
MIINNLSFSFSNIANQTNDKSQPDLDPTNALHSSISATSKLGKVIVVVSFSRTTELET